MKDAVLSKRDRWREHLKCHNIFHGDGMQDDIITIFKWTVIYKKRKKNVFIKFHKNPRFRWDLKFDIADISRNNFC